MAIPEIFRSRWLYHPYVPFQALLVLPTLVFASWPPDRPPCSPWPLDPQWCPPPAIGSFFHPHSCFLLLCNPWWWWWLRWWWFQLTKHSVGCWHAAAVLGSEVTDLPDKAISVTSGPCAFRWVDSGLVSRHPRLLKFNFPMYIQSFVVLHLIAFFHSQLTSWYCFGKRVLRIEFTLWVCATGLDYDRPAYVALNTCSKPGPLASCSVSLCFLATNSSPSWVDFSLLPTISLQGSSLTAEFRHFVRLICQWIPSHTFSRLGLPCVPNSLLGFLCSLLHLRHSILRFIAPLSALVHRTIII